MVKNTKGGSGHKRQARKNTITTATSHKTRMTFIYLLHLETNQ